MAPSWLATLLRFWRRYLRWAAMVCDGSRSYKIAAKCPISSQRVAGPIELSQTIADHQRSSQVSPQNRNTACRKIELGFSRNFQLLWAWIFLNIQGISTAWISLKKLAGIGRLNILEYSWNSELRVLPNCKLGISWIFLNIQVTNTGKLLPENPTYHADSRTF